MSEEMMTEKLVRMSELKELNRSSVLMLMLEHPSLSWAIVVRKLKENAYDDEARFINGMKEEALLK